MVGGRFTMFPNGGQFQMHTGPAANDNTLRYIADLLNRLPAMGNDRFIALTDLFFGLNGWIKAFHERSPQVSKAAYPAVAAQTDLTIRELQKIVGAPSPAHLSRALTTMFGLSNVSAGLKTDKNFNAQTFDKGRRELARLHFRHGLAFRARTPDMKDAPPGPDVLTLVQSRWFEEVIRRAGVDSMSGFAPFVMSLEREFYMARHEVAQGGIFHSAYFGSGKVAAAGTMLIETGRVMAIRGDSGHFRPPPRSMASALKGLQAKGVSLENLLVYDFKANPDAHNAQAFVNKEQFAHPSQGANMTSTWQRGQRPDRPRRHGQDITDHRRPGFVPHQPAQPNVYSFRDDVHPPEALGAGNGPAHPGYSARIAAPSPSGYGQRVAAVSASDVLRRPDDYN